MSMMASQILKLVDSTKTQKTKYLQNETFLLQMKKNHSLSVKDYNMAKNMVTVHGF